jgi:hypothetical protein
MTAPVHLSALREEQHKNAIGPYQARHRGSLADAPAKIHCVANIAHRSRLGTQTYCNTTVQRFNSDIGDQPSADTDRFRKRTGVVPPSRYLRSAQAGGARRYRLINSGPHGTDHRTHRPSRR